MRKHEPDLPAKTARFVQNHELVRPTPPGTCVGKIERTVAERTGFAPGTPLCVGAGDQNCSVLGMGAIQPGLATVTLGTAGLAILATERPLAGFGRMIITHHAAPGMWQVEGLSSSGAFDSLTRIQAEP
jgi:xylulokinase